VTQFGDLRAEFDCFYGLLLVMSVVGGLKTVIGEFETEALILE